MTEALATSFAEHFFGQGFHVLLVVLVVPAIVYLGTAAAACILFKSRIDPRALQATFAASVAAVLVVVVGITLFEAAAAWHRPYGDAVTARTPIFQDRVEIAFLALYAFFVVVSLGLGWAFGRIRAHRGRLVAIAAGIAVTGFLAATLPLVEFLNTCNAGGPILTDGFAHC